MTTSLFNKRIIKEIREAYKQNASKDKIFLLGPDPDDETLTNWYALLFGLDSPFKHGQYLVHIKLTRDWPNKAPVIEVLTPNGKFEPDKKICIAGITHFHEETNNISQTLIGAITGLISIIYQDSDTLASGIGFIKNTNPKTQKKLAKESRNYNLEKNKKIILRTFEKYLNPDTLQLL